MLGRWYILKIILHLIRTVSNNWPGWLHSLGMLSTPTGVCNRGREFNGEWLWAMTQLVSAWARAPVHAVVSLIKPDIPGLNHTPTVKQYAPACTRVRVPNQPA
jgi:hypothetical protein